MVRLHSDLHPLTVDKVLEQLNIVSFQLLSCLGTLKMGGAVSVQQQRTPSQSWLCCRCMYACKFLSLESQTCIRCCQPFPSLLTKFIIFISITKRLHLETSTDRLGVKKMEPEKLLTPAFGVGVELITKGGISGSTPLASTRVVMPSSPRLSTL
jgi:hypothetical protein